MIELRNLVKKFGSFTAVDNVSLRLGKGEFFGFLGLNGAGKTTTIKMMTGLFEPTSGSCWINGHNVHTEPMLAKRSTGYVPDQPWIYDKLTGREFLYFVGGLFSMQSGVLKERIGEMIEAAGDWRLRGPEGGGIFPRYAAANCSYRRAAA